MNPGPTNNLDFNALGASLLMMLIQKPELSVYEETLEAELCAMFKAMARTQTYLFQTGLVELKQQGSHQPVKDPADESPGGESQI